MKKLLLPLLAFVTVGACASPSGGNDAGQDPTLAFAPGTPLALNSLADDADATTAGFQYDVSVVPANSDTSGSVVFTVNDSTQATVGFTSGKATARLTFETADAGTDSINVVSAVRDTAGDVAVGWVFTLHNN